MEIKQRILITLKPFAHWSKILYLLAIVQLVAGIMLPVFIANLDTGLWLINLCLSGFWLATATALHLAGGHVEHRKGFKGWFINLWENTVFLLWFTVLIALLLLALKITSLIAN